MIRLYDTTKGLIITNELNESIKKPGYKLIFYEISNGAIRGLYTRTPIPLENIVEEIPKDSKPDRNLNRMMDECQIIKRFAEITDTTYAKTVYDYEHPSFFEKLLKKIGLAKSLEEILRGYLPK
ncbi:MAG: hypothetical protein QW165_04650 [Candidatus Woesearchaeota archaeon]